MHNGGRWGTLKVRAAATDASKNGDNNSSTASISEKGDPTEAVAITSATRDPAIKVEFSNEVSASQQKVPGKNTKRNAKKKATKKALKARNDDGGEGPSNSNTFTMPNIAGEEEVSQTSQDAPNDELDGAAEQSPTGETSQLDTAEQFSVTLQDGLPYSDEEHTRIGEPVQIMKLASAAAPTPLHKTTQPGSPEDKSAPVDRSVQINELVKAIEPSHLAQIQEPARLDSFSSVEEWEPVPRDILNDESVSEWNVVQFKSTKKVAKPQSPQENELTSKSFSSTQSSPKFSFCTFNSLRKVIFTRSILVWDLSETLFRTILANTQ